jgi:outer membrane protein insertion porin family
MAVRGSSRITGRRGLFLNLFLALVAGGLGGIAGGRPAAAQVPELDSSSVLRERRAGDIAELSGLEIRQIRISGNRQIEERTIRFKIGTQLGEKLSPSRVRQDIRAIFETGFFDNVVAFAERQDESVVLTYHVVEKPALQNVEIIGNYSVTTERLLKLIDLSSREALQPRAIQEAAEKIRQEYTKQGFYYVTVTPRMQQVSDEESKIIFQVDEGDKVRIEDIEFVGDLSFAQGNRFWGLKSRLKKTREAWLLSFLTKSGRFTPTGLQEDLAALKEFYLNQGFLDVKIGEPRLQVEGTAPSAELAAQPAPSGSQSTKRLRIEIPIEEGPRYRVGELSAQGNDLFKNDVVMKALQAPASQRELRRGIFTRKDRVLRPGEWYSQDALRGAVGNVQDLYGNAGYIYASVYPERQLDRERAVVNIQMQIDEGLVAYVNSIEFEGNTRTRDKVLRRELALYEGDVFKSGLFRYSLSRLQALGYIAELTPDVKPASNSKDLDIAIKLNDTRQTELQLGGGYRSPDGMFGQLSISEHNFMGYGQSLSLSVAASKRIQNYTFQFQEPYLFDTNYSGAISLFRVDQSPTEFRLYREGRTGGRVTVGKSFMRYFSTRLSYGFQVTDLSDFRADETNANLLDFAGTSSTSSLILSSSRNSLNNRRDPTRGSSSYIEAELAGFVLGGENNYYKIEAQSVHYFPVTDKLTYAVRGRIGYAGSFRGHELPFFERFRLGGERSVRGFGNYSIGPLNESGNNLGGNKELLINQELIVPLADPLRVVLFLDAANVYSDKAGFDVTNLRSSAGVEVRFFIPQFWVPIRFIWGWKLDRKGDEQPSDFTFSIGTTF